jgi:hypothetical protein
LSLRYTFRARRFLLLTSGLVAAVITVQDDPMFDFASIVVRPSQDAVSRPAGDACLADGAFEDVLAAVLIDDALPGEMEACELEAAENDGVGSGSELLGRLLVSSPGSQTCSIACRRGSDDDVACDCCQDEDQTQQPGVVTARSRAGGASPPKGPRGIEPFSLVAAR